MGKEIIDGEAKKIGAVKDLAWSDEGKLAIVVERGREEEYYLPFDQVEKIGDVVFATLEEKEKKSSAKKGRKRGRLDRAFLHQGARRRLCQSMP